MRTQIVAANWKMHGDKGWVAAFAAACNQGLRQLKNEGEVILFPPAPFLMHPAWDQDNSFSLGVQNFYPENSGAFTGETSLTMLPDTKFTYALVGHSERRHIFKESENFIAEKFHYAKEHGIVPVLCVGETNEERDKGQTLDVLSRQIEAVAKHDSNAFAGAIVAYEPVWAIGTGKTATPDMAQDAHAAIRALIAKQNKQTAEALSILYGGSVKPANAQALFDMPDIDGGLVGGASLDVNQFLDIVKCIS